MSNMNSIVSACLDSLNKINKDEFEGEMMACEQLIESYDKFCKLMEHYTIEEIEKLPFISSIVPQVYIQEADTNEQASNTNTTPAQNTDNTTSDQNTNDNKQEKAWEFNPRPNKANGSGKENIIISILAFVPRLIIACIRFIFRSIKNLFSGAGAVKQAEASINDTASKWGNDADFEAKASELLMQLNKDPNYNKTRMFNSFRVDKKALSTMSQNTNSVATIEDQNKKGTYYIQIVLPVDLANMHKMLEDVIVSHVDKYLDYLQKALPQMTKDENGRNKAVFTVLKNESVEAIKNDCNKVIASVKAETEKVAKIINAQNKAGKLLVEVDGLKTTIVSPEDGLKVMDSMAKLIQNLNAKVNSFAGEVKKLEDAKAMGEVEDGVFDNLKQFDETLKTLFTEITKYINSGAIEIFADAFKGVTVFSQQMAKLIPQHGQQVQPAPANANNGQQNLTTTTMAANGTTPGEAQPAAANTQQTPAPAAQPAANTTPPATLTTTNQAAQAAADQQAYNNMNWFQRAGYNLKNLGNTVVDKAKGAGSTLKKMFTTTTEYSVTSRDGSEIISEQQTFNGTVDEWNAFLTDTYMAGNAIRIHESHYYDENGNEVNIIKEHTEYYQDDNISPLEY